jgi:mannan endo-1,4-beta-mannosidase
LSPETIFALADWNQDYYHGGKYNFLRWRGININQSENSPRVLEFYTNRQVINDFKYYIKILMTHKNQYTGLTYAEDPTIMAYETGNELYGNIWGDMNVPAAWVKEIAQYIKELGPHKLVVDGTYGINKTHLPIKEVDIFSDHFYPINITKLTNDIDLVASVDRVYWAGEIDWTGLNNKGVPTGDSLESFYNIIEDAQKKDKPVVIGDVFWSLFMHNAPDCEVGFPF